MLGHDIYLLVRLSSFSPLPTNQMSQRHVHCLTNIVHPFSNHDRQGFHHPRHETQIRHPRTCLSMIFCPFTSPYQSHLGRAIIRYKMMNIDIVSSMIMSEDRKLNSSSWPLTIDFQVVYICLSPRLSICVPQWSLTWACFSYQHATSVLHKLLA